MGVYEAEFRVQFSLLENFKNSSLTLFVAANDSGPLFLNDIQIGFDPVGTEVVEIQTKDPTVFLPGKNTLLFRIRNGKDKQQPIAPLALIFTAVITYEGVLI